jgi:hypothetical protein
MVDWLTVLIIGIVLVAIGYILQRHVAEAVVKTIGHVMWIIGLVLIVVSIILLVFSFV